MRMGKSGNKLVTIKNSKMGKINRDKREPSRAPPASKPSVKKMMGGGATKSAMKKLAGKVRMQEIPSAKEGLVRNLAAKKRGMKSGGKCKGAGAATKGTRYSKS